MASSIPFLNISYAPAVPSNCFAIMKWRTIKSINCLKKPSDPEVTSAWRPTNYRPPICDYAFIESIKTPYESVASIVQRVEILVDYTKRLLEKKGDTIARLELIDTLERLGVGYLFQSEIKRALEGLVLDSSSEGGLHCTSLYFRIMRQNGCMVSLDVFGLFMDENDRFREDLSDDAKGILSLYEASFLALEGESAMDEARVFTTRHLNEFLTKNSNSRLHQLVKQSLAIPLHWMPNRLAARWFIDMYSMDKKKDTSLLELAKLDYNMCQASLLDNLKSTSRWWKNLGVTENLTFTRARVPESFLLALGTVFQRKYGLAREVMTQVVALGVAVDDLYDHYGNIEELELFTDAVERWDVDAVHQLPEFMRLLYLAFLDTLNQFAYDHLRLEGGNIVSIVKQISIEYIKSIMKEAKWGSQGYRPTFNEYMENARFSVGGRPTVGIGFFLMRQEISESILELMSTMPDLLEQSGIIFRLCDDMGEAIEGSADDVNSIKYYMWEKGVTLETAIEHSRHVIREYWKKMNKHLVLGSPFSKDFIEAAMGFARIAHWCYHTGDGFTTQQGRTLDALKLLVFDPILLDG